MEPVDVRRIEARRHEDLVLAESALLGERRVAWVRAVLLLALGLSQGGVGRAAGESVELDAARTAVLGGYLVLCGLYIFWLQRARPDPHRALLGNPPLERAALTLAVVIGFSVGRFSVLHVAYSFVLAAGGYALIALKSHACTPGSLAFVIGGYAALALLIGATGSTMRQAFAGLRSRDNLARFLPRQVVERLLEGGEDALCPVQAEVTVMFTDIRDFTTLSEKLPPRELLQLLDDYFAQMGAVVKARHGLVNKFLGDGMLAFWGVPDQRPAHAELALHAALDMRHCLCAINELRTARGLAVIRFGVGIHTGTVAAGMLGGADQHEYTVIGDAVNVAARIEGLTKEHACDILVSEETWRLAAPGFRGQRRAEAHVKGRGAPVVVYALEGVAG